MKRIPEFDSDGVKVQDIMGQCDLKDSRKHGMLKLRRAESSGGLQPPMNNALQLDDDENDTDTRPPNELWIGSYVSDLNMMMMDEGLWWCLVLTLTHNG